MRLTTTSDLRVGDVCLMTVMVSFTLSPSHAALLHGHRPLDCRACLSPQGPGDKYSDCQGKPLEKTRSSYQGTESCFVLDASMYKITFAAKKILGEIFKIFDGNFGTDKEFVEDMGRFQLIKLMD